MAPKSNVLGAYSWARTHPCRASSTENTSSLRTTCRSSRLPSSCGSPPMMRLTAPSPTSVARAAVACSASAACPPGSPSSGASIPSSRTVCSAPSNVTTRVSPSITRTTRATWPVGSRSGSEGLVGVAVGAGGDSGAPDELGVSGLSTAVVVEAVTADIGSGADVPPGAARAARAVTVRIGASVGPASHAAVTSAAHITATTPNSFCRWVRSTLVGRGNPLDHRSASPMLVARAAR